MTAPISRFAGNDSPPELGGDWQTRLPTHARIFGNPLMFPRSCWTIRRPPTTMPQAFNNLTCPARLETRMQ